MCRLEMVHVYISFIFYDILTLVRLEEEKEPLIKVNSIHPNLKFAMEKLHSGNQRQDNAGQISFLDMKLALWDDRYLNISASSSLSNTLRLDPSFLKQVTKERCTPVRSTVFSNLALNSF